MKLCTIGAIVLSAGLGIASKASGQALTDAISYQGRLTDAGLPASGIYDFRFRLFDAAVGGLQIGPTLARENVNCVGGLFTVNDLNFNQAADNVFGANARRWLQIEVRLGTSGGAFTTLGTRQELTAAPYALNLRLPMTQAAGFNQPLIRLENGGAGNGAVGMFVSSGVIGGGGASSAIYAQSGNSFGAVIAQDTGDGFGVYAQNSSFGDNPAVRGETLGQGSAGLFLNQAAGNDDPAVYAATAGSGPALHADGNVEIGSTSNLARVQAFTSPGGVANLVIEDHADAGGSIELRAENGAITNRWEPDVNGEGGFLIVHGNDSFPGFYVDGNLGGTENSAMAILGASNTVYMDMNATDTDTVNLPIGAIEASEMLDEPGVAAATNGAGLVTLTGAVDTILSRTITVPAAGYVLAVATCQANVTHTNATTSTCAFGVSDAAGALPTNQDVGASIPAALASGTYISPVTVQGIFSVSAGANTFYFLGDEASGAWSCNDMQLSLVYVPTAYGTVSAPEPSRFSDDDRRAVRMGPMSPAAVNAERSQAAAFSAARARSEMDEMRRELNELRSQMAEVLAEQKAGREAAQPRPRTVPPSTLPAAPQASR